MGFRFRKTIKAGPINFNLSKSGIGTSFGVKGARITKPAKGKTRATFSLPGTGLSYSTSLGGKKKSAKKSRSSAKSAPNKVPAKTQEQRPEVQLTLEEQMHYQHLIICGIRWLAVLLILGFMILARHQILRCLFGAAAIVMTLPISGLQTRIPLPPVFKVILGIACTIAMLIIHM